MTLRAQQLACTRGERALFLGLDLELHRGDALRVAGNNGAGKTSLLRILSGLSMPNAGAVSWCGEHISHIREQYNRQLTYLGHLPGIKDDLTACENVLLAVRLSGNRIDRKAAVSALGQVGLGAQINLPTRVLSQGQKKRVALARLPFCCGTPLWILDEPFVALDQDAVQALAETIGQHLDNGGMLAYSTHQEISLRAQRNLTIQLHAPC
jgi:heme exporter protein A